MYRSLRLFVSLVAVLGATSGAFAAGSSTPTDYVPDPALKRASMRQLQTRVSNACVVIQTREQLQSSRSVANKCACYAKKTLAAFTPEELQEYRNTGVFNRSARGKAYTALRECGLPNP